MQGKLHRIKRDSDQFAKGKTLKIDLFILQIFILLFGLQRSTQEAHVNYNV